MFTTLTVYFKKDLHFTESYIGFLMAVNGLVITFIEMVLVFKLEGKRKNTFYIAVGVFLCGLVVPDVKPFPYHSPSRDRDDLDDHFWRNFFNAFYECILDRA